MLDLDSATKAPAYGLAVLPGRQRWKAHVLQKTTCAVDPTKPTAKEVNVFDLMEAWQQVLVLQLGRRSAPYEVDRHRQSQASGAH
jgi:hypothetical protein